MTGNSFPTIEAGVTAQVQHLFAYATTNPIPNGEVVYDPRFTLVSRGIAPHWEDLNNHWAMNDQYGQQILGIYGKLLATPVPQPVVEQPTPVVDPQPQPEPTPVTEQPAPTPVEDTPVTPVDTPPEVIVAPADPVDNPNEKINGGLINRVLRAILDFFKGLVGKKN
jgi:hypothetical protein